MTGIGLKVGAIAVLSSAVQIVISVYQLGKLFLHISEFFHWKLVFIWPYLFLFEESNEPQLAL